MSDTTPETPTDEENEITCMHCGFVSCKCPIPETPTARQEGLTHDGALAEVQRLASQLAQAQGEANVLRSDNEHHVQRAYKAEAELAALRAERDRLREENEGLRALLRHAQPTVRLPELYHKISAAIDAAKKP